MRAEYLVIKRWGRLPDWSSELTQQQFDSYSEILTSLPYDETFDELETIMHMLPHEYDPFNGLISSFIHEIERSPAYFDFMSSRDIRTYDPENNWLETLYIRHQNWLENEK